MDPSVIAAVNLLRVTGLLAGAEVIEVVAVVVILSVILKLIKKAR